MQQTSARQEQKTGTDNTLASLPDLPTPADMRRLLSVSDTGLIALIEAGIIPPPIIKSARIRRWSKPQVLAALGA